VLGVCREWLTAVVNSAAPNQFPLPPTVAESNAAQADAFRAALRATASTLNGVCAVKLLSSTFDRLPATLARWGIGDGVSNAWMPELFERPVILVLRRRDLIGSAISWWRALHTGEYARFDAASTITAWPTYDFPALQTALRQTHAHVARFDEGLASLAALSGAVCIDAIYEDMLVDPQPAVASIAVTVGVLIPTGSLATPLTVQRDTTTEAVREQFLRDLKSVHHLDAAATQEAS